MAKRRHYDDKFRASVVVMLQSQGYPTHKGALSLVAAKVGAPAMTISRWFHQANNPPPTDLVNEKKEELADIFEDVARKYLIRAGQPDAIESTGGNAAMMTAAVAVDKMRLLRGLPTEIISIIPSLVSALERAGLSAADVFNSMIAELEAEHADSANSISEDAQTS